MSAHDPGQLPQIYVKVAFPVERHGVRDEWLWVHVVRWEDDRVEGVLVNEPRRAAGFQAGSYVAFGPDRIADYHEDQPDGSYRGNGLKTLVEGQGLIPPPPASDR